MKKEREIPIKPLLFAGLGGKARPFLKWAGGKGQLLEQYKPFFPERFNRYFEPFLGGGAVFFSLSPDRAVLSDVNQELINAYLVVRNQVEELIRDLKKHKNDEAYYYQIRNLHPDTLDAVGRASRFVFLNKTCFNGLYRVNSEGKFNVPFGRYTNPMICDESNLRNASFVLKKAEIRIADFEDVPLELVQSGDFVYFDPPYSPLSATSSFTAYAPNGFGIAEQNRLAGVFKELNKRGCFLVLSNSNVPLIKELYKGFRIVEMSASRFINCKPEGRGRIKELLILNF